ncbi:MAG: transposase [Anaerolineae bacterium]|nr:transposase [Anaerolineae bacterium]
MYQNRKRADAPMNTPEEKIINAIAYVLRNGCAWRLMPHDLPPWSTVYDYFRQWRVDGTWERINAALREKLRTTIGEAQPSAAIIDSQSVKTTEKGGRGAMTLASKSRDARDSHSECIHNWRSLRCVGVRWLTRFCVSCTPCRRQANFASAPHRNPV